ncbi:MAG: tellurite resistance protein TerC [Thermoleophilaceae bacterium]|nr:tellurite resistance protein TerC [Thermoleophilaceae bacterium]
MSNVLPWAVLSVAVVLFLWIDLKLFARGREPSFREGAAWSIGWLALSLLAVLAIWPIRGGDDAVEYLTVYLVERSLSLDNLFVFLMLFAYFAIPQEKRPRLLFWGIVAALVMRGLAILGGVALIEQFHFVIYILGATLLLLAYKIFKSSGEEPDPGKNFAVRIVRRLLPGATPLMICLGAIVLADIAFAVDSIPAAFGITRDPFVIWMGNVFALLGMRALFVLVEGLARRFRYLDETIALVLGIVGVKLLIEDLVKIGPLPSLAIIGAVFVAGIAASLVGDRRYAKKNTSPSTA